MSENEDATDMELIRKPQQSAGHVGGVEPEDLRAQPAREDGVVDERAKLHLSKSSARTDDYCVEPAILLTRGS